MNINALTPEIMNGFLQSLTWRDWSHVILFSFILTILIAWWFGWFDKQKD